MNKVMHWLLWSDYNIISLTFTTNVREYTDSKKIWKNNISMNIHWRGGVKSWVIYHWHFSVIWLVHVTIPVNIDWNLNISKKCVTVYTKCDVIHKICLCVVFATIQSVTTLIESNPPPPTPPVIWSGHIATYSLATLPSNCPPHHQP